MRHSALGDSVAAEMGKILSNDNFKSVFQAPGEKAINEFESVVNQEASYKAFTRIASNKSGDKALAFKHIVETIESVSAALDNMGLEKSATVALSLLNGMIKEAQSGQFGQDSKAAEEEMKRRVQSGFGNESDLPVSPGEHEKLPIETPPHIENPFKTPPEEALFADDKDKCCKECKCDPCDCNDDDECMAADGPLSFPKDPNEKGPERAKNPFDNSHEEKTTLRDGREAVPVTVVKDESKADDRRLSFPTDPNKEGPKPAVNPFDDTSKEPTVRHREEAKPVVVMPPKEALKITDKKVIALFNSVNSWLK
jgi:hypothetical protein